MCLHKVEYLVTTTVALYTFTIGAQMGWAMSAIPNLLSKDSPVPVTTDESSWITSLLSLGRGVGAILSIFLADRAGRKLLMVLSGIPEIINWLIIIFAQNAAQIYIARFLAGCGDGIILVVYPIYMGEVTSSSRRGSLMVATFISMGVGVTISDCIGSYTPFRFVPCILIIFPALRLLSYFWMPETPYFYLSKHRQEDAMTSLKYLRGNKDVNLQKELDAIRISVNEDQKHGGNLKELVTGNGTKTAFLIQIILKSMQCFTGLTVMVTYMQYIFEETGFNFSPKLLSLIFQITIILPTFISTYIIDKFGRRPLLFMSLICVTLATGVLGGYFFLKDDIKIDVNQSSWVAIMMLLVYHIGIIGVDIVPGVMLGELFSINIKALAAGVCRIYSSLITFVFLKLYQIVTDTYGIFVSLWIFCLSAVIFCIILYFILPETKGKSLSEIQTNLKTTK